MMQRACSLGEPSARVFDWACEVFGRDLRIDDVEPAPRDNRQVQVGVFVTTLMRPRRARGTGLRADIERHPGERAREPRQEEEEARVEPRL